MERSPSAVRYPSALSKRAYVWGYVTSGEHLSEEEARRPPPTAVPPINRGPTVASRFIEDPPQEASRGKQQRRSCRCFGYTEWEHLVEHIEAFEFRGTAGSFTARKERRTHDRVYWYAYTWESAGRRKTYLGRPAELTLARLETMARNLQAGKRSD